MEQNQNEAVGGNTEPNQVGQTPTSPAPESAEAAEKTEGEATPA